MQYHILRLIIKNIGVFVWRKKKEFLNKYKDEDKFKVVINSTLNKKGNSLMRTFN